MNLTKEITSRKLNFEPQVEISNDSIKIKDIAISIDLIENFVIAEKETFKKFKAEYQFPENSELNKKDRESFADAIFEPIFILENIEKKRPIIACYLFDVRALKGKNNLNIRSINKFELMWTSYLAESKNDRRLNAKRIVTNGLNAAISETYQFEYKTNNGSENKLSNLKILTIEIKDYVLTFYIVDDEKNPLNQAELEKFINGIKN
ncbi:hypothetical protein [Algibacter mikhailovii]|uniref:hypothetical protein n=1 Tax=Algibacter mikhailovii TaxID=425498 RepID=UPI0024958BED|nr:hypothetical protein [Algibacter mikhailovii]